MKIELCPRYRAEINKTFKMSAYYFKACPKAPKVLNVNILNGMATTTTLAKFQLVLIFICRSYKNKLG